MTGMIPKRAAKLAVAILAAAVFTAVAAGAASASTEVAYNNLNTVPATVNGLPNEDTYSVDYENWTPPTATVEGFGGLVEFGTTGGRRLKALTTQLDSFVCEHGEYQYENCTTLKPNKKFKMHWTVSVYAVGAGDEPGALIATSTEEVKLHYRPTTKVTCPNTPEGKGFGANCDVGGFLQTVTFKHWTPANASLPDQAIILLSAPTTPAVNVGIQESYKKYNPGQEPPLYAGFEGEPPLAGGVPEVGSDPIPNEAYVRGALSSPWTLEQPVFKVLVH